MKQVQLNSQVPNGRYTATIASILLFPRYPCTLETNQKCTIFNNIEMVSKIIKYNGLLTQETRTRDYMNLKREIEIELNF